MAISTGWEPEPSTFDSISLNKDVEEDLKPTSSTHTSDEDEDESISSASSSPVAKVEHPPISPPAVEPLFLPPPSPKIPTLSIPPPEDPDGFGTFETAEDLEAAEVWSPAHPSFPSLPSADAAAAWGGAWEEPNSAATEEGSEPDDAWETARQQKEKQDRHVVRTMGL